MGVAGLPGGWLTDRFGTRRVMVGCLLGVTLAGLGRAAAPDSVVLLAATLVLGTAIGTLQPALPRVARDTMPQRTPLATAIYFNGLVVGGAAGIAATPLLVELVGGWRGVLLVWSAFGALGLVGWLVLARGPAPETRPGRLRLADVSAALRLPGMAALTLAMGTQSAIFYTFASWAPTYLVARGWALTSATLPVASLPLTSVVCSAMVAPLELRFGRRAVIAASGAVVGAGLLLFLLWPDQTVLPCAIAIGAGTTWAFGVCMAAPAALAPVNKVGITAGVLLALGYAQSTLGPVAIGSLRDAFGSYEIGWLLVLVLAGALTATALGIPGRRPDRHSPDQV